MGELEGGGEVIADLCAADAFKREISQIAKGLSRYGGVEGEM